MLKFHKPLISIVLPIYNEQGTITTLIKEYEECGKNYDFELVCVDNGSSDATKEKLIENSKKYNFVKIVRVKKNKGYGYGILCGVRHSSGDLIAWTHADMQTHPSDVFRAYEEYSNANDTRIVIKGQRLGRPLTDSLVSAAMAVAATFFLRMSLSEINAQPKLFHRSLISYLKNAPFDFSLDLFLLYQARKHHYIIRSIPVRFNKRSHGKSKWAYSLTARLKMIAKTMRYIIFLSINSA